MKKSQINVKNVDAEKWERLLRRFPASPSLIIRALVTFALSMSDEQYTRMLNEQAAIELKEKGL